MTKAGIENFINACTTAGINEYGIRYIGGNKTVRHNTESCRIALLDTSLVTVETNPNYGLTYCPFLISNSEYENVDGVFSSDLTVAQTIDLLTALGVYNDELKDFISKAGSRSDLIPGTAGLSVMKDKDGNTTIGKNSPGYVTK